MGLGAHLRRRPIAPWLTKFAKRSVVYPGAYSFSSYTAKSVVPALVGEYPSALKLCLAANWYRSALGGEGREQPEQALARLRGILRRAQA